MYKSKILDEYTGSGGMAVADIETTGLSARKNRVILGGLLSPNDRSGRLAVQYFADSLDDEEELLGRYADAVSSYGTIITYNGRSFDIPFMKKRMKAYGIGSAGLDSVYQLDLYRVLKKYSGLPDMLPDLRQKTVEKYMGISQTRRDAIDGGESVRLYYRSLKTSGPARSRIIDSILLHNRDDIVKLSEIISILRHLDVHEIMYNEGFPVTLDGRRAVIDSITVGSRGMHAEGHTGGRPEAYSGFEDGAELEVSPEGNFSIHIQTEDVEGWKVTDLSLLGADVPELQELPGYESGYLILKNRDRAVQYHEVNCLVRELTRRLLSLTQ